VLSGEVKDVLLLDVTPLSLGIETLGGVTTKLIERNTTIPVTKRQVFTTADDNQTAVTVHVLQGEREFARDNRTLGRFNLEGLPPAPRGLPQIEVSFDIDANGILHVSAKDTATNREQRIRIESSSGLSEHEIDRMVKDAESHASEDQQRKKAVETRNAADALLYSTEKTVREHGDKVSVDEKAKIEAAMERLRVALKGENASEIESASNDLQQVSHAMAEAMYRAAQPGAGSAEPEPAGYSQAGPAGGDTVDAAYTVVGDEKAS
jgi:molecular chaperone DnaK